MISSNKMEKMIKRGAQAAFLHYYAMEGTTNERKNIDPPELEQLLEEHSDINQNPPHGFSPHILGITSSS